MFAGKSRNLTFWRTLRMLDSRVGFWPCRQTITRLERFAIHKHSSLLQKFVKFDWKKFYNIGTRSAVRASLLEISNFFSPTSAGNAALTLSRSDTTVDWMEDRVDLSWAMMSRTRISSFRADESRHVSGFGISFDNEKMKLPMLEVAISQMPPLDPRLGLAELKLIKNLKKINAFFSKNTAKKGDIVASFLWSSCLS